MGRAPRVLPPTPCPISLLGGNGAPGKRLGQGSQTERWRPFWSLGPVTERRPHTLLIVLDSGLVLLSRWPREPPSPDPSGGWLQSPDCYPWSALAMGSGDRGRSTVSGGSQGLALQRSVCVLISGSSLAGMVLQDPWRQTGGCPLGPGMASFCPWEPGGCFLLQPSLASFREQQGAAGPASPSGCPPWPGWELLPPAGLCPCCIPIPSHPHPICPASQTSSGSPYGYLHWEPRHLLATCRPHRCGPCQPRQQTLRWETR